MRVLNVAEKNDAAKCIASALSHGTSHRREGFSKFNKIYEFPHVVFGQNCQMLMTSVSGHLLAIDFPPQYADWGRVEILDLFAAPIHLKCPQNYADIRRTLEREARSCQKLIIWTDCDREGENIGFEVINVCSQVRRPLSLLNLLGDFPLVGSHKGNIHFYIQRGCNCVCTVTSGTVGLMRLLNLVQASSAALLKRDLGGMSLALTATLCYRVR